MIFPVTFRVIGRVANKLTVIIFFFILITKDATFLGKLDTQTLSFIDYFISGIFRCSQGPKFGPSPNEN